MTIAMPEWLSGNWRFMSGFYVKAILYVGAFYINYYYIVDHTLGSYTERHKLLKFVLINLAVIAVCLLLGYLYSHYFTDIDLKPRRRHRHYSTSMRWVSFLRDAAMVVLSIGLAVAMRLSAKWHILERQKQELIAAQHSTELDNLKSQLNPHFLFNTLNTIYALIDINPDAAKDSVHQLSGLLRYTLYEDSPRVELKREIDFIKSYSDLMRHRLGKRPVEIKIEIDGIENVAVPPLLFIPLIENAFKYGNTPDISEPITISIRLDDQKIVCSTENSFFVTEENKNKQRSSGIGLQNLRRRLVLIYGSEAALRTSITNGHYKATLSIPIQSPDQQ